MPNRLFSDAQKTYSVAFKFSNANINKQIRLIENNPNYIKSKYGLLKYPLWVNGFVDELYCFSAIKSIPEVGIPPISQEDDEYVRLQKTLNYEWATSRFELSLYIGNARGTICEVGRAALKNSQGYPYRRHRLIDLLTDNTSYLLGENDFLAIELNTYNLSLGATDTITITGNWKQEVILVPEQQIYSNVFNVTQSASTATPSPTPTPTPTGDITTTKQFTNDNNSGTATPTIVADTNSKRKSITVKLITGSSGGGYFYKVDTSPLQSSEVYWQVTNSPPASFLSEYTGRVSLGASPGYKLVCEVTEVSNP